MQLVCEACGEENDFYQCVFAVRLIEVDGAGQELGHSNFEDEWGAPWYKCAVCGSEKVCEAPVELEG